MRTLWPKGVDTGVLEYALVSPHRIYEGLYRVVIYFCMTITRAEKFSLPQRSTELIVSAENTSDGFIWSLYVGVQSVSSRIETEAELDS